MKLRPEGFRRAAIRGPVRALLLTVAVAVVPLLLPPAARAQEGAVDLREAPRPTARAVPASGPVRVDAHLDEPAWRDAPVIDRFIQARPDPGLPATERSEVRILYDDEYLYVGAILYDSDPDGIVINTLERDSNTADTDVFAIVLDTFRDRQNSFSFFVNPAGAIRDGQTFNDSRSVNFTWDAVMEVATRIHDEGWTVEMAIPWRTLRFDAAPGEQEWGMNLLRRVRWKHEDALWAPLERHEVVYTMSRAGTLEGLQPASPGHNLYIKPFTVGDNRRGDLVRAAGADEGWGMDGGVDLKYGITPGLTLDLTWRTDFSQVEVDQERVNLTRFSLFFPERRDFFLENSGIFAFGDVTERSMRTGSSLRDLTLFHSRRIGLTGAGTAIPIHGGGRLSGQLGAHELGFLSLQTASTGELPGENFAVGRVRRQLLSTSDVGLLVTNRQATDGSGGYNRAVGADVNLRPVDGLVIHGYLAGTRDSEGGDGTAGRLAVGWRDGLWNVTGFWRHVGDGFDPGIGFVRRSGIRHAYGTVGLHPRPGSRWIQEVNPYVESHHITDLQSEPLTRRHTAGFSVELWDGGVVDLDLSHRFERLTSPFRVQEGASVAPGDYTFGEASARYASSRGRPLSASLRFVGGGFYDGDRRSVGLGTLWRPTHQWALDLSLDHNRVSLPEARFTADVYGLRVAYAHTTELFSSAFVQYNAAQDQLVTNIRFRFVHAPLSDLYVVLMDRRDLGGGGALERMASVKITRMVAF